jgi:hypothetical protein
MPINDEEVPRLTAMGVFMTDTPVPLPFGHGNSLWVFGRSRCHLFPTKYLPLGTSLRDALDAAVCIMNKVPNVRWSGTVVFVDQEDISSAWEANVIECNGVWMCEVGEPTEGIPLE